MKKPKTKPVQGRKQRRLWVRYGENYGRHAHFCLSEEMTDEVFQNFKGEILAEFERRAQGLTKKSGELSTTIKFCLGRDGQISITPPIVVFAEALRKNDQNLHQALESAWAKGRQILNLDDQVKEVAE